MSKLQNFYKIALRSFANLDPGRLHSIRDTLSEGVNQNVTSHLMSIFEEKFSTKCCKVGMFLCYVTRGGVCVQEHFTK